MKRRVFLKGIGSGAIGMAALGGTAGSLWASDGPIELGVLTPLTGAGGNYGPSMAKVVQAVVESVNAAGGVLGRQVALAVEDSQTNPEAAIRGARKLIDVDKVNAIVGLWSGAVSTAVAPLCWESGTVMMTVSGAESITKLPHQGYIFRTQPNTTLQGEKAAALLGSLGAGKIVFMTPQTPFADSQYAAFKAVVETAGGTVERIVYDDKKPTLRSEVDNAIRTGADGIMAAGYTPDSLVLLRDLYRAGYEGRIVSNSYAVNQSVIDQLPAEVTEGIVTQSPSPALDSDGYAKVAEILGVEVPDPYSCQAFDQIQLTLLAIAKAGAAAGSDIRDALRDISQGGGTVVTDAVDGIARIAAGEDVDYQGASGNCEFNELGDIVDAAFTNLEVKSGKLEPLAAQ